DRGVVVHVDIVVDHDDVLVAHMRGGRAPDRVGDLLGLSAIGLLDRYEQVGSRTYRRTPDVGDAGNAGAVERVPRGRGAEDRGDHRVLGIAPRHAAFDGATQDRIVSVGDG